jgi:hypothetical protein
MLALSSLATDYTGKLAKQRATMVIGGIAAVLIANIPGNSVLIMFMIYGTLRASTLLITVLTLLDVRLNGRAVAVGIATAMAVGFPFFIWGNLANLADVKLWGSIGTVLASGTIAYIGTKIADSRRVVVEPVKEKIAA